MIRDVHGRLIVRIKMFNNICSFFKSLLLSSTQLHERKNKKGQNNEISVDVSYNSRNWTGGTIEISYGSVCTIISVPVSHDTEPACTVRTLDLAQQNIFINVNNYICVFHSFLYLQWKMCCGLSWQTAEERIIIRGRKRHTENNSLMQAHTHTLYVHAGLTWHYILV